MNSMKALPFLLVMGCGFIAVAHRVGPGSYAHSGAALMLSAVFALVMTLLGFSRSVMPRDTAMLYAFALGFLGVMWYGVALGPNDVAEAASALMAMAGGILGVVFVILHLRERPEGGQPSDGSDAATPSEREGRETQ